MRRPACLISRRPGHGTSRGIGAGPDG